MIEYEMVIAGDSGLIQPAVLDGVTWQTERKSYPGCLSFDVVIDKGLRISEGNNVHLRVDGKDVFNGFIFKRSRDKEDVYKITAYDQLRYFKNKDTYNYQDKTASQLLKMVCNDFNIVTGEIEDTGYVIPTRLEDNKTLFDVVGNALDLTLAYTKQTFCLYDSFGKVNLKNVSNMVVPILIDAETGQNFDYSSSIDDQTYDKVKLIYENDDKGARDPFIAQDDSNINRWGVLQYFDTLQEGENGKEKAEMLLNYYNKKTRSLMINNAFGDVRVRAGTMVMVQLDLGDTKLNNLMLVEKAKHTFRQNEHYMDLNLKGVDIFA